MRLNSISFKLIGSMLLITTSILAGLGFFKYNEAEQELRSELSHNTDLLVGRLKLNLPPAIWNIDDEYIASALKAEAKARFIKGIYILDEKNRLVEGIERAGDDLSFVDELPPGSDGLVSEPLKYIDRDADESYGVGMVLISTTDQQIISALESEIRNQAIQVLALNIILILLFSVAISRMTRPLGSLKDLASNISQGNYELDINIDRKDEIGELADSFTVMKEGIRKKVKDLKDLNDVSEKLASTKDQKEALRITLQALSEHSLVESGSVYLLNQATQCWEIDAFTPDKDDANGLPRAFAFDEGIVGLASKEQSVVYVANTREDERFSGREEGGDAYALICVPLNDEGQCFGVLNFSGDVNKVQFGETDYEYAETIARQLVVTLKNIRMREEIEEHNRTLELKVRERTAELHQKNQDIASMMQNMHQGLFTITSDGKIHHEYAAFLEEIFETQTIAGINFADLLFSSCRLSADAIDQNITGVDAIVGEDDMMFGFNEHCLVREMTAKVGEHEKVLELDWDPIIVDDVVEKLMVTVRDVTELRALQAEAEAQKAELSIIAELLAVDAAKVDSFFSNSMQFIESCSQRIKETTEKDLDVIADLFRSMHTVKGNARTYNFVAIKDIVHEVESVYDELRKNEEKPWDQAALIDDIQAVLDVLNRYRTVFYDKLGMSASNQSGIAIEPEQIKSWIDEIHDAIQSDNLDTESKNKALDEAYKMLIGVQAKPLRLILDSVSQSVGSIAEQLAKPVPNIDIKDADLLIENDLEDTLNNIFMHVFRNAIDHGIEGSEERLAKSKPEQGTIQLSVDEEPDYTYITIRDDGRGIAIDKIYGMALEKGIFAEGQERPANIDIANLIFSSGFSTAETVSDVSGRGVGMDAVKTFLENEGGTISIVLDEQEDAPFMSFATVIRLPTKFIHHQALQA